MKAFILKFVAVAAMSLATFANAENLQGRVVGVSDGDTLTLLTADNRQVKVRLAGIDAPEKAQDFGAAAKKSLSDLVYNQTIIVGVQDIDRYGRTIGWVSENGADINASMVNRGMAWVYRQYIDEKSGYGKVLVELETAARTAKTGLWSGHAPVPPWAFRKAVRTGD